MAGRGRKRVCVLCGNPIDDNNESIPYKKRYAHITCFNAATKAIHADKEQKIKKKAAEKSKSQPKPKAELKDGITDEEYVQKSLYYDYLREILKEIPAKVYALTDNYIKKYNFSFQGMYQTLTYMKNILEKGFTDDIVGLIPYYYNEADRHYKSVRAVEENNKDINTGSMYKKKTIYIDPKKKKIKQIDITTVGGN